MKRTLSLVLVLAMLFGAMLSIIPTAEASNGTLKISAANVQFANDVYLLIAVDYSALGIDEATAKEKVTLSVSYKGKTDPTVLAVDESVMTTADFPANSVGFKFTDLGAKNMGDKLTLQAYYNGTASGASVEYSILEYTLKARTTYSYDADFIAVCDAMIKFGASAQKAFAYVGDYPLYNESGVIKYGMISVFNSVETISKQILAVGTEVAPTSTKTSPMLYDYSYNRVADNKIIVSEGVNSYFFISANDRTARSFDATNETLTADMINGEGGAGIVTKNVYTDVDGNFYSEVAEGRFTHWFQIGKLISSGASSTELIEDKDGKNIALKMVSRSASSAVQFRQKYVADTTPEFGNVFTLSVVIGKEGETTMTPITYRTRSNNVTANMVTLFGFSSSGNTSTFRTGSNTGIPLADITTDGSGYSFITVHMVFDLEAHTVSYYTGNSSTPAEVITNANLTKDNVLGADGYVVEFVVNRGGTILLQKSIYTKGNIFE